MTIWTRRSPPTALPEGTGFDLGQWSGPVAAPPGRLARLLRLARRRLFALLVLLPTALVALYFAAFAAPQYESEARFVVRGRQPAPTGGVAELLGGTGIARASEDAMAVRDYLGSHDAVAALRARLDLIGIYRRPEADLVARLWSEAPDAERLLDYLRRMARAELDTTSGIATLRVRAFRAEDAAAVAATMLALAEAMVNRINQRLYADQLAVAQAEVERAEARVAAAQRAITAFRARESAPDPGRSAALALETIARLEAALAQARADFAEAARFARADNPRLVQARNRVDALAEQVAAERAALGIANPVVPAQLGAFESLTLERDLAQAQLASATASLERARVEAQRQQVFLLRIVEPQRAEWARHPRGLITILTVFAGLAVAYGLAWLLIAGMREHAA